MGTASAKPFSAKGPQGSTAHSHRKKKQLAKHCDDTKIAPIIELCTKCTDISGQAPIQDTTLALLLHVANVSVTVKLKKQQLAGHCNNTLQKVQRCMFAI